MAFDPSTGQTVLFGGNGSTYLNDTWVWDGSNWTQKNPADSPSVRDGAAMSFDPSTGEIVLFGGSDDNYLNDTWAYSLQVAGPTAQITTPTDGQSYTPGEVVNTAFSCEEAAGGPGIDTCVDSSGGSAPAGTLDTSTSGPHTYTVTATSENGLTGTAEITCTVLKASPALAAGSATDAEVGRPAPTTGLPPTPATRTTKPPQAPAARPGRSRP